MNNQLLTQQYRRLDNDIAMLAMRMKSTGPYERSMFVPHSDSKAVLLAEWEKLMQRTEALEASDRVHRLLKDRFREFLTCTRVMVDDMYKRPMIGLYSFMFAVDNLVHRDSRSCAERRDILMDRFAQLSDVWEGMRSWLKDAPSMDLKEIMSVFGGYVYGARADIEGMEPVMAELGASGVAEIAAAIEDTARRMEGWIKELQQILTERGVTAEETGEKDIIRFEESYYRKLLGDTLGVELDELLEWHEDEVEKTREECLALAAKICGSEKAPSNMREVDAYLHKHSGACSSSDEMFARQREYISRARAAAHQFISLPEDETCGAEPIAKRKERDYPWGAYESGCSVRRPLHGVMVLNKGNYKNISDGWLKMTAIHECYPGHHAQFVRQTLDTIPQTQKIYVMGTPLKEGTAHRSEREFAFIFEEDPLYPLFVAYRRHHTATRIKADLWLRYFGRPIGDAVQLYVDELGVDPVSARGQVRSQESMQAFYTSYYYGVKKLEQLEKQSGLSSIEFTRRLFDVGDLSLGCFKQYLELNQEERSRYLTDYSSIYQFGE